MAKYRQIHTTFWNDSFVLELTPEEKYFYLYLMTNDQTTQCGIYELPIQIIEMQTGYNRETSEKLLARFEGYGKVKYSSSTKEIFMTNWAKYNWINSIKVIKCIEKELKSIKNQEFIKEYLNLLIGYGYRIDSLSIDLGEEEEKEQEQEEEEEEEKEQEQEEEEEEEKEQEEKEQEEEQVSEIIKIWDNNGFGINNIISKEKLLSWLDDSAFKEPKEIILKAMGIACSKNKRTLAYIEGILKNWENQSLLSIEEIEGSEIGNKKPSEYDTSKDAF